MWTRTRRCWSWRPTRRWWRCRRPMPAWSPPSWSRPATPSVSATRSPAWNRTPAAKLRRRNRKRHPPRHRGPAADQPQPDAEPAHTPAQAAGSLLAAASGVTAAPATGAAPAAPARAEPESPAPASPAGTAPPAGAPAPAPVAVQPIPATPAVRRLAREIGVAIGVVTGYRRRRPHPARRRQGGRQAATAGARPRGRAPDGRAVARFCAVGAGRGGRR